MNDNMINKLDVSHNIAATKHSDSDKQESLTRTITSDVLFAGRRELLIKHASESYRLRITNQGKLILTK
jgi:hemin uptake protein HemP